MKAAWNLLTLVFRQLPVAAWLLAACFLAALVGLAVTGLAAWMAGLAITVWFYHILAGISLRGVLRHESLLLPRFRARLALAAAIDIVLTILVPVLVALVLVPQGAASAGLLGAGLLLLASLGLGSGLGMRAMLLFWVVLMLVGWLPDFAKDLLVRAVHSPLMPILMVLVSVLLCSLALRPLLEVSDHAIDASPLGAALGGNRPGTGTLGSASPRPRTPLARWLRSLLDSHADSTLVGALARHRARPGERTRIALVRAVLLPHDNPRAVLVQVAIMAVIGTGYFFLTHAAQRWDPTYVGAYAVILGTLRFASIGQGMVRMRAHLAELYLTLAPRTRRAFQATLADAMLWLVAVAVFNCIVFALLIILLLHAQQPLRLMLAAGISGLAGALGALSVSLVGPDSTGGSMIARLLMLSAAVGTYALVYWLLGRFGPGLGAGMALVLTLPFGIGAWRAARSEYLKRSPRFDVPL